MSRTIGHTEPGGEGDPDDRAPLFRSWNGWYLLLIIVLLAQVIGFFLLTQYFS